MGPEGAKDDNVAAALATNQMDGHDMPLAKEGPPHVQTHSLELERNFSLLSVCGLAISTGESWVALGNSIAVAISAGGPTGVIYELVVVSFFYWVVAASVAELASAVPSSGTVYQWATLTAGSYGRVCGWFAGWWNFLAWILGVSSLVSFMAFQTLAMYATVHVDYEPENWHMFVCFVFYSWLCCSIVLFGNRVLPIIEKWGLLTSVAGFLISIVVCSVMPFANRRPYAPSELVWNDWKNNTGWSSNGFVFCLGMLNGAFAVGAPDIPAHLAEEIPRPRINVPKAILAQYVFSFFTAICYLIAIFYAISDLEAIVKSHSTFPLVEIYRQATGSEATTVGLLVVAFVPTFISAIGGFVIVSRTFWSLSRDNAAPFSQFFAKVDQKTKNPFNAIFLTGVLVTLLGCIYVGSARAFNDLAGSFVVLLSLSYITAILPHLLSGRSIIAPGPFWMKGASGFIVNGISCLFLAAITVIFCFPPSLPLTVSDMNYTSLIVGGLSVIVAGLWFWRKADYVGPILQAGANL